MTAILGISAFYHDSAAALVVDGEIVAAAQEEEDAPVVLHRHLSRVAVAPQVHGDIGRHVADD
ncbi:MAG TPA: hypothetical protein EYP14_11590, partial [Planctomycetaceae bacterium]|nr:hypothetical protein [Planctomycetaceae bacterium]